MHVGIATSKCLWITLFGSIKAWVNFNYFVLDMPVPLTGLMSTNLARLGYTFIVIETVGPIGKPFGDNCDTFISAAMFCQYYMLNHFRVLVCSFGIPELTVYCTTMLYLQLFVIFLMPITIAIRTHSTILVSCIPIRVRVRVRVRVLVLSWQNQCHLQNTYTFCVSKGHIRSFESHISETITLPHDHEK